MKAFSLAIAALSVTIGSASAQDAKPLTVVASFSIIADFAATVGGERVAVTTLVGPGGDAHVYEPRPADAAAVAGADIVLVNGLGFDGFVPRLIEASGSTARLVEVSAGIEPLQAAENHEAGHDDPHEGAQPVDPHAWQSVPNAQRYVQTIAEAFCGADASGCDVYRANAETYLTELRGLDSSIRESLAAIAPERRTIITSHDAFGYFQHEYGLVFLAPEGVSTDAEPTAADVAALIRQIRDERASAIFVESITDPRLIKQIASETGLTIGGELFSDSLSPPDGPAATYIKMMEHNVAIIANAVRGS